MGCMAIALRHKFTYLMDEDSPPLNFSDPFLTWSYAEDMIVEKNNGLEKKKKEAARKIIHINSLACLQPIGVLH